MPSYPDEPRPEVAERVPATARRLLDVGCSRGAFGKSLADRGIEVWGVEPDRAAASVAATRLARVLVGGYPEAVPEGEKFDCIIFNDVLEHMLDPAKALKAARSHLTVGGCVLASIPNVRHYSIIVPLVLNGRWDYTDLGVLDRTHLRWFTKSTMRELFGAAGYEVELQEPINATLSGKARILELLGKRKEEFAAPQYLLRARPHQYNQ